jgi:hypothetical protein
MLKLVFFISTIAGNGTNSFSGDGGNPLNAIYPLGIVYDNTTGNLFFSENGYDDYRIRVLTNLTTIIPTSTLTSNRSFILSCNFNICW